MSFRRVGGLAAMALSVMLWMSCGDIYRPVVIPVAVTPPNSANFHAVFAVSSNALANPGAVLQIDVSGDTNIGQAEMGINPTHAAILPNNARVFVASAGSLFPGQSDIITAFSPAVGSSIATGLGLPSVFTYPNVGPIGPTGVPDWFCSYLPDFLTTNSSTQMYAANYGVENDPGCAPNLSSTDSVTSLSSASNSIGNIAYLPPGSHPVALAATPNGQNLYAINQGKDLSGNNTVVNLSPTDLSTMATIIIGNTPGSTPVWAVARADNQRVYVLTQGDIATQEPGKLIVIDTATNTVLSTQDLSIGFHANFILYDAHLSRLYVTNPGNTDPTVPTPSDAAVYVFSTTGGTDSGGTANDTPRLLTRIPFTPGSGVCPSGCFPVSVSALPDGSRFYVASYQSETTCSDANVGATSCIIPLLTVFDAPSMSLKPASAPPSLRSPSISLLSPPNFAATQYALPPVASCATPLTYTPGTTRFRMFTTAASDSSHVYVSVCDAGMIADVVTGTNTISTGSNSPDTLVTNLAAPSGVCSGSCSSVARITSLATSGNVVTFTAANSFTPGTRVGISQTGTSLDGQTLTVLAAGLSANSFSCNLNSSGDQGVTGTKGQAVPLAPMQSPIFLLTGQ